MHSRARFALRLIAVALNSSAIALAAPPADGRPALTGDINIEQSGETKSPYAVSQDAAIAYFEGLGKRFDELAGGSRTPIEPPGPNISNYLTGAYLFCSVNQGSCPFFLESVLEIDAANSMIAGSASCPTMLRFWKQWVDNDMESRHKYLVKTGFLQITSDFKLNVRPRFLKCKETIESEFMTNKDVGAFFKQRYSPDSQFRKTLQTLNSYLAQLKREIPNAFVAVGAQK